MPVDCQFSRRSSPLCNIFIKYCLPLLLIFSCDAAASADISRDFNTGVYLYKKGFMHQKVILADDSLVGVGTANFDVRAMYLNFETTLVIHDVGFNTKAAQMLEEDFAGSAVLKPEEMQTISFAKKFRGNLARVLGPLL